VATDGADTGPCPSGYSCTSAGPSDPGASATVAGQVRQRFTLNAAISSASPSTAVVPLTMGSRRSTVRLAIFRSRGRLFITDSGSMNRLTYVASSAAPATIGPTGEMRRVAMRPMSRPAPAR